MILIKPLLLLLASPWLFAATAASIGAPNESLVEDDLIISNVTESNLVSNGKPSKWTTGPYVSCFKTRHGIILAPGRLVIPTAHRFEIDVANIKEDAGSLCHKLWAGLKKHGVMCQVWATWKPRCYGQPSKQHPGYTALVWGFETGVGCSRSRVHGAFWEATKNRYGEMKCKNLWAGKKAFIET